MPDTIKWTGEITFDGTIEEFREFGKLLQHPRIKVKIPNMHKPPRLLPGYPPLPQTDFVRPENLDRLIKEGRVKTVPVLPDIAGGIRMAHVHMASQIVLLGAEQFKLYAADLAKGIAEKRVAEIEDPVDALAPFVDLANIR
jgi:hypothetical protein